MLSVRLLPHTDQGSTRCAERTNAFNACSSSEDDHLSTPSISPHGVHCKRRGRCQIPWRMSTHLPTQRCKVSITADNTNSPRLHSKSLAAPARATPPWRSPSAQRPHPPPCSSWRIQLAPKYSLPSYIEGATCATLTSLIEGLAAPRRPCHLTHSWGLRKPTDHKPASRASYGEPRPRWPPPSPRTQRRYSPPARRPDGSPVHNHLTPWLLGTHLKASYDLYRPQAAYAATSGALIPRHTKTR